MGIFKKKIVKRIDEIYGEAWGHLISIHKVDVDTLYNEMRCVERKGALEDGMPVTFLRIFRAAEIENKGIVITGWEILDEHPDLVLFEGYITEAGKAHLERKK